MALDSAFYNRERAWLDANFPQARQVTDIHFSLGQSNGRTGNSSDTGTFTITHVDTWALDKDDPENDLVIDPLVHELTGTGGTHAVGPGCALHGVCAQIQTLTGRRQLVKQLAVSGAKMLNAADGPDFHWEVDVNIDDSLVLSSDPLLTDGVRDHHMDQVVNALDIRPDITRGYTIVHWWQGENEHGQMNITEGVTPTTYATALGKTFDYYRDNHGVDLFCIYKLQRIGADPTAIAANAAQTTLVRSAQQMVIDARSDTISVWDGGTDAGSLVVDGDGVWVSGVDMYDATHPRHDVKAAVGRHAGNQIITELSLPTI